MDRVSQSEFAQRIGVHSSVFQARQLGVETLAALGVEKGGSAIARGKNANITYPENAVQAVEHMVKQGMKPVFAIRAYAYRREIIEALSCAGAISLEGECDTVEVGANPRKPGTLEREKEVCGIIEHLRRSLLEDDILSIEVAFETKERPSEAGFACRSRTGSFMLSVNVR